MSERYFTVMQGDALETLRSLPDCFSVDCCITSPPYWGLRDYGSCDCSHFRVREGATNDGGSPNYRCGRPDPGCDKCEGTGRLSHADNQLGLEATPEQYVEKLVAVFREVRRVLRDDGTLWLNLGDSYATGAGAVGNCPGGGARGDGWKGAITSPNRMPIPGLKPKDLVGIPWRVAFALQADGWYLRSDIIWAKPNPMPESVTDRPTKAHEYIFLLSKSRNYYYDAEAIAETAVEGTDLGLLRGRSFVAGTKVSAHAPSIMKRQLAGIESRTAGNGTRNKRSVWTVTTQPYSEAHFATFPPKLIEPCVLAGCPEGGTVLDPFAGAGTTGVVALRANRRFLGIELNPEYVEMAKNRILGDAPLFNRHQHQGKG